MGEHVVHLARDPPPLGLARLSVHRCSASPRGALAHESARCAPRAGDRPQPSVTTVSSRPIVSCHP